MDSPTPHILLAQCKAFHPLEEIAKEISSLLKIESINDFNIHISLPYSYMAPIKQQFPQENIHLGAEVFLNADEGCFTVSIAGRMVKEANGKFVLIGTPQDRTNISESHHLKEKLKAALEHKIIPFICVGESLQEHQDKNSKKIIIEQLKDCLEGIPPEALKDIFIVYNAEWISRTPWEADSFDLKEAYQSFREAVVEATAPQEISSQQLIVAVPGYSQDISQLIQTLNNSEQPFHGYSLGILGSSAEYLQPLIVHSNEKTNNILENPEESSQKIKNPHNEEEENKENENV